MPLLTQAFLLLFVFFNLFFIKAYIKKDASVVDIAWGLSFIWTSGSYLNLKQSINSLDILSFSLIFLWGMRLSIFLYIRNSKIGVDQRYVDMQKNWQPLWPITYLRVFVLQCVVSFLVATPIHVIGNNSFDISPLTYVFSFIAIIAIALEGLADWQKYSFKQKNKEDFCNIGLWKYSRHPNYFFEIVFWFAFSLMILPNKMTAISLIGALLITFFLLKISGIPLLEVKYKKRSGWEEYKKQTNRLIPFKA